MSDSDSEQAPRRDQDEDRQRPGGAEGGDDSPAVDTPPGLPADDDSPLGDTDQHSSP